MALKALSGVTQGASRFARLPNGFTRSSKLTQTLPIDGVNKATIRVVIGATASGNGVFNGSATASVTITASANGQQTDQQHAGVATVNVAITAAASGTATGSGTTHSGTASCQVNLSVSAAAFNTATQVPDETTNGNTMTLLNDPVFTSDAAIGNRSLDFDGSNDYAQLSDTHQSTFRSSFSIGMWVRLSDGDAVYNRLITNFPPGDTSSPDYLELYTQAGLLKAGYRANELTLSPAQTTGALGDGDSGWFHVVLVGTRTSSTEHGLKIYKNGSNVANQQVSGSSTIDFSAFTISENLAIARAAGSSGVTSYTDVKIDDVSIWSKALSSTEVSNLYNSGSGTDLTGSSDLEGWWKMGDSNNVDISHSGTATASVAITASASGSAYTVHSGTASCQVNLSASASGTATSPWTDSYSIDLDGTNDYVAVSGFDANALIGTGDMTAAFWVKYDTAGGSNQNTFYIGKIGASEDYILVRQNGSTSKMELYCRNNTGTTGDAVITASSTVSVDTWYHVVFTRTGTTGALYINATSEGSLTDSDFGTDLASSGSGLRLGSFQTGTGTVNGHLNDVAIWDEVLTSSEITAIYNSGSPTDLTTDAGNYASSSGLIGYWKFEENSGTSIADSSSNSNAATLTNGPTFSTDVPVAPTWANDYSIALDGTNDYIDVSNFDPSTEIGTGAFTMSMWVKADSSANQIFWYMGGGGTQNMMRLNYLASSGGFKIWAVSGGTWSNQYPHSSVSTSTGTWYNVTVVRSGTTVTVYTNGANSDSKTHSSLGTGFGSTHWVGQYWDASNSLDGNVDEYALWDEALTSSEVEAIYNSGTPINLASDSGNYASSANLVGYWRMEENTGTTVADSSTNSNTATLTNGPTFSTDVPLSAYSLDFDGTDDYIEVSDHDNLSFGNGSTDSAFTMAGWVKLDATSLQRFITKSGSSTAEYIFGTGGGSNLLLALYDDTTSVVRYRVSTGTLSTGTWTHVAVTHTSGTIKLYIDGTEDSGTSGDIGSYTAMHNSTGTVRLGGYQNGSQYTNGKLDELAVWDEALTATEISAMAAYPIDLTRNVGNYSSKDNLVAFWRLENNANDSSGNNHTGTVASSPTYSTDTP